MCALSLSKALGPDPTRCAIYRKGIRLIFRNQAVDTNLYGNVNELGDVGEAPGKSSLFFLTA
jgi:hypothetical protein